MVIYIWFNGFIIVLFSFNFYKMDICFKKIFLEEVWIKGSILIIEFLRKLNR